MSNEGERHGMRFRRRGATRAACGEFALRVAALSFLLAFFMFEARAQVVVDRTVATVSSGSRAELITMSDIRWQLALQPEVPLAAPSQAQFEAVLELIISQRLLLQEAGKLPSIAPTDDEIERELRDIRSQFSTTQEFLSRAGSAGLGGEQLREIARERAEIAKYIYFRFHSFTVVTPKEVSDYYTESFVPAFRRQRPGQIVPALEEVAVRLEEQLREAKIEADTDAYLESLRERAVIVILSRP